MKIFSKICLVVIVLGVVFIGGVLVGRNTTQKAAKTQVALIDTTYNTIVLDSIEYNITKVDTIIYNLKQEMRYEIDKSFQLDDSATIILFKKLCTAED